MPEELEEVFDGVQFWGIGRQEEQRDVVGEIEIVGGMPSGLVEDDDGMGAFGDLGADFRKMQAHGLGVGVGQNQGRRFVGFWTGCGKQISSFVALIFGLSWPAATTRPLAGQLTFLADPGFIGEPDFYRAFSGSVADGVPDQILEFFL